MSNRLKILITNIWLADFAGSEVVVRDLALGLLRRGHRPIVYSPTLGSLAEEIAVRGVSVIDDLRQLGEPPDIIHAHHSIPCGEALIRFPDVPAIYVCHAFNHWSRHRSIFPRSAPMWQSTRPVGIDWFIRKASIQGMCCFSTMPSTSTAFRRGPSR